MNVGLHVDVVLAVLGQHADPLRIHLGKTLGHRAQARKGMVMSNEGYPTTNTREMQLESALRAFLYVFAHNEDGEPEDMIANLPEAHAFEMIDQAAHRDVPIPSRAPCITVGQIRRARALCQTRLAGDSDTESKDGK